MQDSYEFTVEPTKKDLIQFNLNHLFRKTIIKYAIYSAVFVAITAYIRQLNLQQNIPTVVVKALIDFSIFFSVITVLTLSVTIVFILVSDQSKFLQKETMIFSKDYFKTISETSEKQYSWKEIESLVTSENYFFMYLNKRMANVIPKRCIPENIDPKELQQFINEAMDESIV